MTASKSEMRRHALYGLLTNIRMVVDASGLATNTNNAFGTVDGSNIVTAIKSILPGPTGIDFGVIGSGVTFDPTTKSIQYNGSGRLRHTGASSVFNFMSYNSAYALIKHTTYIVCKLGNVIKPASANYGLWGNNGGSSVNKGVSASYANTTTNEDTITSIVTKGVSADFLGRILCPGVCPSNQWIVIGIQFDGNASAVLRMRLFVNDQAVINIPMLDDDINPVTTPTYAFEIGGVGNSVAPLVGGIKEMVIAEEATTYGNAISFIRSLMLKHGITRHRSDFLDVSSVPVIFDQSIGANPLQYHLSGVISQDPTNPKRVFSAYSLGGTHVYNANKRLVGRLAANCSYPPVTGAFAAGVTIYNPTDPFAIQDCGGGFDNNGVMHLFVDVLNSGGVGGCVGARHFYSSDLTNWTNNDITSVIHADGLAAWRMYGNLVHANGIWVKPYYKATDQGVSTQSANYILRSTDGINWTSVVVRAVGSNYYNEGTVAYLGGNNWLQLVRDEVLGEWQQYFSTDNALTWTAQGAISFGLTVTSPNPPMLKTFMHNGVLVVVAYLTDRANDTAYAVYGKASDIISSGLSGWNLNTKIMWWKTSIAPYHYHYGDVAHLNNTIQALGLYSYDQFPGGAGGENGVVNYMNYTTMPTWHVSKIESELGI